MTNYERAILKLNKDITNHYEIGEDLFEMLFALKNREIMYAYCLTDIGLLDCYIDSTEGDNVVLIPCNYMTKNGFEVKKEDYGITWFLSKEEAKMHL